MLTDVSERSRDFEATFSGCVSAPQSVLPLNELVRVGVVWNASPTPLPTLCNSDSYHQSQTCYGPFKFTLREMGQPFRNIYARVFATNRGGITGYSKLLYFVSPGLCLVAGTPITVMLENGQFGTKLVEDITYLDDLVVWDFDAGKLTTAKPLWIKTPETITQHDVITLADGRQLHTVGHRVFSVEAGAFVPITHEIPETTTMVLDSDTVVPMNVVSHETLQGPVTYYNVVTDVHLNLFANGILTSCRYSNLAPIRDMRYCVNSTSHKLDEFEPYARGMQLARQTHISAEESAVYIGRMRTLAVPGPLIFLDIQGVMRTKPWPRHVGNLKRVQKEGPCFDVEPVQALNELLITLPQARIVISSDWAKWCTLAELQAVFTAEHIIREPIATLVQPGTTGAGTRADRAAHILAWVEKTGDSSWIAIDDMDMTPYLPANRAVCVPAAEGLTKAAVGIVMRQLKTV